LTGCPHPPAPGSSSIPEWAGPLAAAAEQARADDRLLLLNFSGSDWCGWCIRLDEEVLSQPEFKDYADQNLVTVTLDFPRRSPQPEAERALNQRILQHFGVRGFPTLLLFSPDGELIGRLGYQPGGPAAMIRAIEEVRRGRTGASS